MELSTRTLPLAQKSAGWHILDFRSLTGPPLPGYPLKKAKAFHPLSSDDTPRTLFTHTANEHQISFIHPLNTHRLVRRTNAREMLIYTDGSCYGHKDRNGISQRRGGCAFIFKPSPYNLQEKSCSFRLERLGPTGVEYPQTSNRAKLRAVIAALQFRVWRGEHFKSIVIGTDSEYVVLGITDLIETWAQTEWQTFGGTTVKNKDLWKLLLVEINKLAKEGCEVHFWLLPIHHNEEADWLAKEATTEPDVPKYLKYFGALV